MPQLVQILTVYQPGYFLLMASIANTLKGVSMMAGGSTRAAFNISFAQGENIADITAKATSQYISTSLLGTCVGIILSSQISNNVGAALVVSCVITAAASVLTYRTIRSVPLANLNSTRLQLLIARYEELHFEGPDALSVPLPRPSALCATDPVVVLPWDLSQVRRRARALRMRAWDEVSLAAFLKFFAARLCAWCTTPCLAMGEMPGLQAVPNLKSTQRHQAEWMRISAQTAWHAGSHGARWLRLPHHLCTLLLLPSLR